MQESFKQRKSCKYPHRKHCAGMGELSGRNYSHDQPPMIVPVVMLELAHGCLVAGTATRPVVQRDDDLEHCRTQAIRLEQSISNCQPRPLRRGGGKCGGFSIFERDFQGSTKIRSPSDFGFLQYPSFNVPSTPAFLLFAPGHHGKFIRAGAGVPVRLN